jgi:hypothetical protein
MAFRVVVRVDTAAPRSLNSDALQAAMELELRRSGVTVIGVDSADVRVGVVNIDVSILALKYDGGQQTGNYVYIVDTDVRRWMRNPTADTLWSVPISWRSVHYGYSTGALSLSDRTEAVVKTDATTLANAILASRSAP